MAAGWGVVEIEGGEIEVAGEGDGSGGASLDDAFLFSRPVDDKADWGIKMLPENLLTVSAMEFAGGCIAGAPVGVTERGEFLRFVWWSAQRGGVAVESFPLA